MTRTLQRFSPPALPVGDSFLIVVGAAIVRGDRCLVGKRPKGGSQGGLWEFPGGKVRTNEEPKDALTREIREELDVDVQVGEWLGRGTAQAGSRTIVLDVYFAELADAKREPKALEHLELRWLTHHEFAELNFAEADVPLIAPVCQELSERARF